MDQAETQDVNTTELETVSDSSNAEQTPEVTDANSEADVTEDLKTVPYDRFKEVNDELRSLREEFKQGIEAIKPQPYTQVSNDPETQQRDLIKEQLKPFLKELAPELGLVSKEELIREKQDQALSNTLTQLGSKYDGKDGRPAFDKDKVVEHAIKNGISNPESAYRDLHFDSLQNWAIQQALSNSKGLKTEGSDGSGSSNAGTTNDDLRAAAAKGDRQSISLLMKRIAKETLNKS